MPPFKGTTSSAFSDADALHGGSAAVATEETWGKLMLQLVQACEKGDLHAAIRNAMTEPLAIDQSTFIRSVASPLPPKKLAKVKRAIGRLESAHSVEPGPVDSRALQPMLKMIETVERDPVLCSALQGLPLVKQSRPLTAPLARKSGGKGGGGRGKRSSKAVARLNLPEQIAQILVLGARTKSLHTLLVGIKSLVCLYETSLGQQSQPELPQIGRVLSALEAVRLRGWEEYMQLLEVEEQAERVAGVRGCPRLEVCTGQPSTLSALSMSGPATAIVRSVRAVDGLVYYEATLTSSHRTIRGLRIGWAVTGSTLSAELGEHISSFGFDGHKHKVYSNARKVLAPSPVPGGDHADTQSQPLPAVPMPAPLESKILVGGAEAETGKVEEKETPPRAAFLASEEESFDFQGLGGLFEEEEVAADTDGQPDGGRGFGTVAEGWKSGDIVGCLLDFDAKSIMFHVNGVTQGEVGFLDFDPGGESVCPAISMARAGTTVALNLGEEPFRFEPFFRTSAGTIVMKEVKQQPPSTETPPRSSLGAPGTGGTDASLALTTSGSQTGPPRRSVSRSSSQVRDVSYKPVCQEVLSWCLELSGAGQLEVSYGRPMRFTSGVTVEVLLKLQPPTPETADRRQYIIGSSEFGLIVKAGAALGLHNSCGCPSPDLGEMPQLPVGVWMQLTLVMSVDASMILIFRDGERLASAASANVPRFSQALAKALFVGGRPKDGSELNSGEMCEQLHGSVAEVRLWSVVRAADEIESGLGRAALEGDEEGLAGWWRMDQGSGHAVQDARHIRGQASGSLALLMGDVSWGACCGDDEPPGTETGEPSKEVEVEVDESKSGGAAAATDAEDDGDDADSGGNRSTTADSPLLRPALQSLFNVHTGAVSALFTNLSSKPTIANALLGVLGQLSSYCRGYLEGGTDPEVCSALQDLRRSDDRLATIAPAPHVLTFLMLASLLRQLTRLLEQQPQAQMDLQQTDSPAQILALAIIGVLHLLRTSLYHLRASHVPPGNVGLGNSTRRGDASKPFLYRLLDSVLHLLGPGLGASYPSVLVDSISAEAAEVVTTGLVIFFHETNARRCLLRSLLAPSLIQPGTDYDSVRGVLPTLAVPARRKLLRLVCAYFVSSLPAALEFVPPPLRTLACIPARSQPFGVPIHFLNQAYTDAEYGPFFTGKPGMRVGSVVMRGPDWRWGDQDGGAGSRGMVVSVENWGEGVEGRGRKLRVVWSSGLCNVYRWNLPEGARVVCDVSPVNGDDAVGPGGGMRPTVALPFSVAVVRQALSGAADTRSGVTKRTVLKFLRLAAPPWWLEKKGLYEGPESVLVRDLAGETMAGLYEEFAALSGEDGHGEMEDGTAGGSGIDLFDQSEEACALLLLLLSPEEPTEEGAGGTERLVDDPTLQSFAALLSCIMFGVLGSPKNVGDLRLVDVLGVLKAFRDALRTPQSRTFRGESGILRQWNWVDGTYERVPGAGQSEGGADGRFTGSQRSTQVEHIRIDSTRCHSTMTTNSSGLTLVQGPDKGWGVALSRVGFARNTGVHRWTVRLDRVNRRGHVFLGVARRSVGLTSFLGNDSAGWGYLQTQDLYYAGSRKRSPYGEKMSQGSTVELVLDSDRGTLSIGDADRSLSFGVAFSDLWANAPASGPDALIYPAFSLHHTGDMVTLTSFEGTPAPTEGDELPLEAVEHPNGLSLSNVILVGPPPPALISHVVMLMESALRIMAPIRERADGNDGVGEGQEPGAVAQALDHAVVSLMLPTGLLALYRWQSLAPSCTVPAGAAFCSVGRELLRSLDDVHQQAWALKASAASDGQKSEAAGRVATVVRLQLVLSVLLGRQASADFQGPLDAGSNDQRLALEPVMMPAMPVPVITHADKITTKHDQELQRWISSPLFANGLSEIGISTPHPALENRSLDAVLHEMTEGEASFTHLERWLTMHASQPAPLVRLGGTAMTRAVRASLAALLHHAGCLKATLRLAAALHDASVSGDSGRATAFEARHPPQFLLDAWKAVVSLRQWARSRVDAGVAYETSAAAVMARVRFLLELQPSLEDQPVDAAVDAVIEGAAGDEHAPLPSPLTESTLARVGSQHTIAPSLSDYAISRASSSGLSRSFSHGSGLARLRKHRYGETYQTVMSFLKEHGVGFDLVSLRAMQVAGVRRAKGREKGLRLLEALLRDGEHRHSVARAALLVHLTAAMRHSLSSLHTYRYTFTEDGALAYSNHDPFGVNLKNFPFNGSIQPTHYLHGLDGCGAHAAAGVRGAFESLMAWCTEELTRQDIHLLLPLLDAWGVVVRPEDHDLIARARLFNTLQDVLKSAADEDEVLTEVPGLCQVIIRATMTVVYLLAMQIATVDDNERSSEFVPETPRSARWSLQPVPLVRIRSGPATLTDSVFRMLFTQLEEILEALEMPSADGGRAGGLDDDTQMVLFEMTTLLLYVCDTPVCRGILSRPEWILLLLKLVRLGPSSAKQRALRLLRSLLPFCPREGIEAMKSPLLADAAPFLTSDDLQSTSKALIVFLLDLISTPCQPDRHTKVPESVPVGPLALSQEALALVDALLATEGPWVEVTYEIIAQALEAAAVLRGLFADTVDASTLHAFVVDDSTEISRTLRLGISALSILGASLGFVYPGGRAEMLGHGRKGVVVRVDWVRGEADIKLHALPESLAPSAEEMTAQTVPLDILKPLAGVSFDLSNVPESLVASVISIMAQWAFVQVTGDASEDAAASMQGGAGGDGGGAADAAPQKVWDLVLLIRTLQCLALRAVHALVLVDSPALTLLLNGECGGKPELFRDLLQLAVKRTESTGLADVGTYEEYLQLLMLLYQQVDVERVKAEEQAAAEATTKAKVSVQTDAPTTPARQTTSSGGPLGDQPPPPRPVVQPPPAPPPEPELNPLALQLSEMGFKLSWCARAVQMTGDNIEDALNWILANGEILAMEESAREARAAGVQVEPEPNTADAEAGQATNEAETPNAPEPPSGTETWGTAQDVWVSSAGTATDWPRIFHCDPASGSFVSMHDEPNPESGRVGTVFGGDELMAVAEQGEWLQVKLDYVREEDEDDDDDDDEKDDEDEDLDDAGDDDDGDTEDEAALAWISRRASDGRVVILPGPSPDPVVSSERVRARGEGGESEYSDSIEDEEHHGPVHGFGRGSPTLYRITDPGGLQVRRGIESSSPVVATLAPGSEVEIVQEAVDSRGTPRLRLVSPMRGWTGKRPGTLEKIQNMIGEGGSGGEGGVPETEAPASLDTLPEAEAQARLEDELEIEVGQELFRKEERFFPAGRHAQAARLQALANGGCGAVSTARASRRARALGSDSVNSAWKTLCAAIVAKEGVKDIMARLRRTHMVLQTLYARDLILALMLRWHETVHDSTCPIAPPLLTRPLEKDSTLAEALAADIESFLRLVVFRGGSESGFESRFARFCGRPFRTLFQDGACLDLLPHGLRQFPALLGPVISTLLHARGAEPAPASDGPSTLSRSLLEALASSVARQLLMAAGRAFAEASWSEATYENDDDEEAVVQPNLHLVRWTSRLLYQASVSVVEASAGDNTDEKTLGSGLVVRLFRAWATALKSAGLSMKHLAAVELASMLSNLLTRQQARLPITRRSASLASSDLVQQLLDLLPAERLRQVAASRLGMENEDAPMHSRYLQALVELVAVIDEAELVKDGHELGEEKGEKSSVASSAQDVGVSDGVEKRPVLRFDANSGSNIYVEAGREHIDPPWTAEFWIRREDDKVESTPVSVDLRAPRARSRPPGRRGALVGPRTAATFSFVDAVRSGGAPSMQGSSLAFSPPLLSRARSVNAEESAADTASPLREFLAEAEVEALNVMAGGEEEEEFLLLNAEDMLSAAMPPPPSMAGMPPMPQRITSSSQRLSGRGRSTRMPPPRRPQSASLSSPLSPLRSKSSTPASTNQRPHRTIRPLYLLRSSVYSIKLQAGGNVYDSDAESKEDNEDSDPVPSHSLCLAVSASGDTDRTFDYMLPYGKWTHLAFVARRSHRTAQADVSLYADGELIGTIPIKLGLPVQMVGSSERGESFCGQLAGFRYWSYERSGAEIRRDMPLSVSEATEGLISSWHLKEGRGAAVTDSTNTFRVCTQRQCQWEVREDVPRLEPSFAERTGREGLLYPIKGLDEVEARLGGPVKLVEMTGVFEREAVRGVDGRWVRHRREPIVVRYAVAEDDDTAVGDESAGPASTCPVAKDVEGVVEFSERRVRAFCQGTVAKDRLELVVGPVLEGCPEAHGWIVGARITGAPGADGSGMTGEWEVEAKVVRKKALSVGQMRFDSSTAPDDVMLTEEDQVATKVDVRGGGSGSNGAVVLVEVCPLRPLPNPPSDCMRVLNGAMVEVVDEAVDMLFTDAAEAVKTSDAAPGFNAAHPCGNGNDALSIPKRTDETYGYTSLKWFWEVLIVNNSSGNIGVGVCTSGASTQGATIGRDANGWAYYSTSEMLHEGSGPRGTGTSESFGNGDVIGVELDLWEGVLRFVKNDRDLGLYFPNIKRHPAVVGGPGFETPDKRGFRPCVVLGGPADKVTLLGLKCGEGRRVFSERDSFQRLEYVGRWKAGQRHGPGLLKYRIVPGMWRGIWWYGKQHGLQLWCRLDAEGREVEAIPFVFREDIKVEGSIHESITKPALEAWETLYKYHPEPTPATQPSGGADSTTETPSQPPGPQTPTGSPSIRSPARSASESLLAPAREVSSANEEGIKALLARSTAPYVVRVILETGATVRNGVEIDLAEQVRSAPQGTVLEVLQRVVTAEGIPRLQIHDGWISERLRGTRGGVEDPVVEILRHLPATPLQYRILRGDGALVRHGAELDSPSMGLVPSGTVITVSERRRLPDGTMRLRIEAPEEWKGWASEKPTLVELVDSEGGLEREQEAQRRALVRSIRTQSRAKKEALAAKAADEAHRTVNVKVRGQFSVTEKTLFVLDRAQCSPGIRLADDFLSASLEANAGSSKAMVLGSRGFRQGVAYWEVRVEQANWGSVFIGVAPRSARLSGWQGYGFLNYRAVQAYGSETLYGSYYGAGDTVGVLLDMDRGTIAFIKDGEDFNVGRPVVINMGVAYHYLRRGTREGISTALYPCFGMKGAGDQLSIRQCKWYHSTGMDRWRQLSVLRDSMHAVRSWWRHVHQGRPLSVPASDEIHKLYRDWKSRRKLRYSARGGGEVEVDCTRESLVRAAGPVVASGADLQIGMRLTTPYGEGRIVGSARGDVWYALDSEGGKVWYWTREELEVLIASERVMLQSPPAAPTGDPSAAKAESVTPETQGPFIERGSSCSSHHGPTPAAFTNLLSGAGSGWTAEMDEALVRLVNSASSHLGIPGTHISHFDLETALRTQAQGPLRAHLERFGLAPALVRFSAILWLNRAVSRCAALVNFALPSERAVLTTDHDVEAGEAITPALGLTGPLTPMGSIMSSLRGVIFTSTKFAIWNDVVQETTTLTVPPADEYERPDELREVVLNRMQARRAQAEAETLSYEDRLRLSLFGQLREHMAGWDDRTLRRSFVHMQDAGQARAFYVKFTGEGVDDHGGPYRAIFETAVGEEPAGPLELLVPCPNARGAVGENRDQNMLNADLKTPARLQLFHHLGRLMGVATRHRVLVPLSLPALVWKSIAGLPVGRSELQAVDTFLVKALAEVESGAVSDWEEVRAMLMEKATRAEHKVVRVKEGLEVEVEKGVLVRLAEEAALKEGAEGLRALLEGLSGIIPVELLSLFTASEVEALVCGVPTIDVGILQKATDYEGVSPTDQHIQYLWQVLQEMDMDARRDFINFCSGRSRLPASAADFPTNFKLTAPQPRTNDKPDDYLPAAQTCFFSLSLPRYSSKEVCREKLLYAIRNADLMDADFMMRTAEGWENIA